MKDTKTLFFFDTETSGLDPTRHGIVQIAWIVDRGGDIVNEYCTDVALDSRADISLGAIECNNFTIERMQAGRHIGAVLSGLKEILRSSILENKAIMVGHNVSFDISMLRKAIDDTREQVGYYLDYTHFVDTRGILQWYAHLGKIKLANYKLVTACEYFGIKNENAHDALSDIRATRDLYYCLKRMS